MGLHVRDPLKRRWERSVYMGAGSSNPEAIRRAQQQAVAPGAPVAARRGALGQPGQ
jgi:hypothetical protein